MTNLILNLSQMVEHTVQKIGDKVSLHEAKLVPLKMPDSPRLEIIGPYLAA